MGAGYRMKANADGNAEILIYEDIGAGWFGGVSAKQFAADLKALGKVSTINVRINSYGGEVFDGLAIYRNLVDHPAEIITHVDGIAASIASVVAMAGNEIRMAEAGRMMIHEAWGVAIGPAGELRAQADVLDGLTGSTRDIYAGRTRQDPAAVLKMMKDETWMDAKEAVAKGFATSIVENMRAAARYNPKLYKFRHAPAELAMGPRPDFAQAQATIERMQASLLKRRAA